MAATNPRFTPRLMRRGFIKASLAGELWRETKELVG
jgi:hypothetical protein